MPRTRHLLLYSRYLAIILISHSPPWYNGSPASTCLICHGFVLWFSFFSSIINWVWPPGPSALVFCGVLAGSPLGSLCLPILHLLERPTQRQSDPSLCLLRTLSGPYRLSKVICVIHGGPGIKATCGPCSKGEFPGTDSDLMTESL